MKIVITRTALFALVAAYQFLNAQPPTSAQANINRLIPAPVPKSPNAAFLGKFGDYKVSHYNGLPEISIPIFEVVSGDLSLPISLNYHASGVKPTDIASWVGLGWSLSAGGQVSRSVQGLPDERIDGYYSTPLTPNPAVCGPTGTGSFNYLKDLVTGQKDSEPDMFSYNLPGKNGKFMLPYGEAPYLIPAAPITINPYGIQNFDITDEAGVLYRFGTTSNAKESSNSNNGAPNNATTTWLLTQMVAPNSNDQINLSYQHIGNATTNDVSYAYVLMDRCYLQNSPQTNESCPVASTIPQQSLISHSVVQRALETITFETGKVEFALMQTPRLDQQSLKALDSIAIYGLINSTYIHVKTVKFKYSYFTDASGGNAALKLDEVHFKDNANMAVEKYKLSYFTNSFSWDPATNYLHYRDWWGYYNGATQNTDLYPRQTVMLENINGNQTPVTIGGAWDRSVNTQFIKEGVLKKIEFPTGGQTEFDFESHKYLDGSTPVHAGGLRVTKITSSPGSGAPPVVKVYKYGANDSGYGYPKFSQNQFNYMGTQYNFSDCLIFGGAIVNVRVRSYHSNSAFAIEDSSVGYTSVTEYNGDPAVATQGKTVYEFDNGSAVLDAADQVVPNSGKFFKETIAWKRGLLTRRSVYDASNNIIAESMTSYKLYGPTSGKLVGVGAWQFVTGNYEDCPVNPPMNSSMCTNELNETVSTVTFFSANYSQSSGLYLPQLQIEKSFEKGTMKMVSTEKKLFFDNTRFQLIRDASLVSNGDSIISINRYPFQLSANSSSTGNAKGVYMLNSKHIISTPIESYIYIKNASEKIVSGQITCYRPSESNPSHVVPDKIYLWESGAPVLRSNYQESSINGSNNGILKDPLFSERVNMISYSEGGDILSVAKTNAFPLSYQYGVNKALAVAQVTNALNTKYFYDTYSTGSTSVNISSSSSPSSSQQYQITVGNQGGTVRLKLSVLTNPAFSVNAHYTSALGSGQMTNLSKGDCGLNEVIFSNVAPGTYTFTIHFTTSSGQGATVCGQIQYPTSTPTPVGITEFTYENFEEGPITTSPLTAHTGKGYHAGDYTTTFVVPNGRSYIIEYWYWNGSAWIYATAPYTTPVNLTAGDAIDNVRIYPADARMKSYTYDPILGMTSVIDKNGTALYYDYDSFGRLWRVRNDKGGIEKQYTYNYKTN